MKKEEVQEMEDNRELKLAWEFVEYTGKSIFLTGKAGTGKTTFLKNVMQKTTKRLVIVAPTGVAAVNAGGNTIHSFFQLPFSPFVPHAQIKMKYDFGKEKRNIIRTLDLLIIDEISMVRSDLLDAIDSVLRRFRDKDKPFGGVQLLMIGDLQQLTPVVTPEDAEILRPYYDTPYFFGSNALRHTDYVTIELKQVYRQQDASFVSILNSVREGYPSPDVIERLNERYIPHFRPSPDEGYIRLTTHNHLADRYNENELANLPGKVQRFDAEIQGTFPEYAYPTAESLELKVGAQVMFIKNDPSGWRKFYNGRIGHVISMVNGSVYVKCPGDDNEIEVEPMEWENAKYQLNPTTKEIETQVQGVFKQLPLRLAWAITIHKSQGLTFEKAIIDAALSFASGQVYVALSRCKTLEGLVLASQVKRNAILCDQRVEQYIVTQEQAAAQSVSSLQQWKDDYHRNLLTELFDIREIAFKEERLCRLFVEYLSHGYPSLTSLHRTTVEDMKKNLSLVSLKWSMKVQLSANDELHSAVFMDRIKRGATYFKEALGETFGLLLARSAETETNNKELIKRLKEALTELRTAVMAKIYLFEVMERKDFSTSAYLKAKQHALLDATDMAESDHQQRTKRGKKEKKKAVKEPKENTKDITIRLYREGKSMPEIAQERNLTLQTIAQHITHFIASGELSVSEFVPEEKQQHIIAAIHRAGKEAGFGVIKEFCPPDISYSDIHMVYSYLKKEER